MLRKKLTPLMTSEEAVAILKSRASKENLEGMARFGIDTRAALGVRMPDIRKTAKMAGKDIGLALELWASGIHEARILAGLVAEPEKFTRKMADKWARDFDSWDVCDGACLNLFWRLPFAEEKILEWSLSEKEFVKRAAFSLIAVLAVHDKKSPDAFFERLLELVARESGDNRNFVRKAVNWALRQIGKRNTRLNSLALKRAGDIKSTGLPSAKWIASDAIRELENPRTMARIHSK